GLAAVLPVMQVLMVADLNTGYLSALHRAFGEPERSTFVIMLCALMVLSFAVKAVFAVALNWWSFGVLTQLQIRTSTNMLEAYLRDDFLTQRQR
ncbi:hypothetical protein, partial [Bacillus cereus group sp. Bce015]|uniref:hypothetical protein n=1 Tax=Bacillus cereus group sp. Bce015 TaxID=3445249 RepID=UPI003F1ED7F8